MAKELPGFVGPDPENMAPREVEPRPVALGPDERELGVVVRTHNTTGGEFQTDASDTGDKSTEERSPNPGDSRIEGWVAGIPVLEGVGAATLTKNNGVQVRMEVVVGSNRAQVEWLKSRLFGGGEIEEGETA